MGVDGIRPAPYRIETERLVIRCYEPADAPLVKECVDSSLDHLRPWMPWARFEPQTIAEKVSLLRSFRAQFDADENYIYGIFAPDGSRQLGGTGLHQRGGPASLEIGYFIRSDAVRQGFATEVTAVLTRVAIEICGVDRVDVQVDPANVASLGVPRKLGFVEEATLRHRLDPYEDGTARRDSTLFTMLADELPISACSAYGYVAFDAVNTPL